LRYIIRNNSFEDERYARGISPASAVDGGHTEDVLRELGYGDDGRKV